MARKLNYSVFTRILSYFVSGGIAFWTPCLFGFYLERAEPLHADDTWVFFFLISPCCFIIIVDKMHRLRTRRESEFLIPLGLASGIWASGPLMHHIGTYILEERWFATLEWTAILIGVETLLFPIFTLLYSTYTGPIFALVLVTLYLGGRFVYDVYRQLTARVDDESSVSKTHLWSFKC